MTNTRTDSDLARSLFFALTGLVFITSITATIYFCRSMCCEMDMPGGWTMSMMWMGMPGQTWTASAVIFLLMWLALMIAMMLPSALPMLLNFRRSLTENGNIDSGAPMLSVASGYFFVWLAIGVAVYGFGVTFALAAMRLEWLSRAVPALSGVALIVAGAIQFTGWKMAGLRRCREPRCCAISQNCNALSVGWHYGLKQGMSCCICCTAPMLALLVLGAMNFVVMMLVASVIAMEKLTEKAYVVYAAAAGEKVVLSGRTRLEGGHGMKSMVARLVGDRRVLVPRRRELV